MKEGAEKEPKRVGKCLYALVYVERRPEPRNEVANSSVGNAGVFVDPGVPDDENEQRKDCEKSK